MGNREAENCFQNVSSSSARASDMRVTFTRVRPCSKQQPSGKTFTKGHCDVFRGLLLSPRLFSTLAPTPRNRQKQLTQLVHERTKAPRYGPLNCAPLRPTSPLRGKPRFHILSPSPTRAQIPAPVHRPSWAAHEA